MSELHRMALIERLAKLRDDGHLTIEEFETEKVKLLREQPASAEEHQFASHWRDTERGLGPVAFALIYITLMAPTYMLPWITFGTAFAGRFDVTLVFLLIHMSLLLALVVLTFLRGRNIGKEWIAIMPTLALAFDLVPFLNFVPLVPTALHCATIIIGFRGADRDSIVAQPMDRSNSWLWALFVALLTAVPIGLTLISFFKDDQGAQSQFAQTDEEDDEGPSRTWNITRHVDPMTDATVVAANARFSAPDNFLINVMVRCEANQDLVYRFAIFNEAGTASRFRSIDYTNQAGPAVGFTMRLNNEKPRNYLKYDQEFSNVIEFGTFGKSSGDEFNDTLTMFSNLERAFSALGSGATLPNSSMVARADFVTLKFPMSNGDALLRLDQSDPDLRGVLKPCLEELDRRRAAEQQSSPARQISREAATPQIYEPTDPEPNGPTFRWFSYRQENEHLTGKVSIRATISKMGDVLRCEITQSSGHANLDEQTCDALYGRKFNPATNEKRQPVEGFWSTTVNWGNVE